MPGKYQPLADYLAAQDSDELVLRFAEIEQIISSPLPASAYTRRYWANIPKRGYPAHAWLPLGWRSAGIDLRRVTFRRQG